MCSFMADRMQNSIVVGNLRCRGQAGQGLFLPGSVKLEKLCGMNPETRTALQTYSPELTAGKRICPIFTPSRLLFPVSVRPRTRGLLPQAICSCE